VRKHIIFFVLVILVFIAFSHNIDVVYADFVSSEIEIFVPEKMIVGESYHGMVTILSPSQSNSLVLLSVDNDFVLGIDASVNIPINKNHGIFEIYPLYQGEAEVFVSYDGKILSASTVVFSEKSGAQKLQIILPSNSTIASDISGFVFLLDGNDPPVPADKDTMVTLVSSEKIIVPANVVIKNGTSNVNFPVTVRATGEITAMAYGLSSGYATIQKSQEIINVKMAIAPNIILEGSYTNYFIWLEKDGLPYTVQGVQKVEIQTSDMDVVRLGVSPASYKNQNSIITSMYDGMAKGRLYTGERGIAEIFVTIPNYGSTSSTVYVGATLLGESNEKDVTLLEKYYDEDIFWTDELEINYIQFAVYPSITDDYAYGVASLYHAEQTEEIEIIVDEEGVQITNVVQQTVLVPSKTEDIQISISSQSGIEHDSSYLLNDVSFPTHSKIFEITANNVGNYTITATGGNSHDTANLQVTTTYNSKFSILSTLLPVRTENTQPLLMISIVDENGNIIDISDSFGSTISLNIHTINGVVGASSIKLHENVGIVSGFLTKLDTISISSDMFGSSSSQLTPSGIPVSVEFLVPDNVHAGEPFPITIHEIDSMGVPISKKQTSELSSTGFEKIDEGLIVVDDIGESQISILAQIGGAFTQSINSFVNEIDFDVLTVTENVRVGVPVIIKMESSFDDIEYFIDSPFPSEKINENTFTVTPSYSSDNIIITITGKLDGFNTLNKQLELTSENIVELRIVANDTHGIVLSPDYKIHLSEEILEDTAPNTHLINPQHVSLVFFDEYSTFGAGYRLVELYDNDKLVDGNVLEFYADGDHTITIIYDRVVKITVNGGHGSGVYSYGEEVVISAPSKEKLSYLIMEKFSHWQKVDKPEKFVITADSDYMITAVYQDDYTILMIVIVGMVVSLMFVIFRKGDSKIRYHIITILDSLKTKLSKMKK